MTDEPDLRLELIGTALRPGGELAGAFVIPGGPPPGTRSVEFSVLWHTSGKGTEDLQAIHYRAWKNDDGTLATLPNPHAFTVTLPKTPWSYDGKLVKIHWVARLRVRWVSDGRTHEALRDTEFVLTPEGAGIPRRPSGTGDDTESSDSDE
jgi:hypothetical protein